MITYSFIIPHHNTPDLLQRLIDTIPQRDDIEIIVVDDNSDDDKKANVSRPDVKTIFIDKEHTKGAGRARNVGMDAATGKWLLFADADDLYKEGFIDVLDEYKDDDIEMLFYNIDSVDSDTLTLGTNNRALSHQKLIKQYDGSKESTDNLLYFAFGPWRRMVKRDFILKYDIKFEEICVTNDSFFSLQVSYFATLWKVDTRTVYILTYRKGSITFSKTTKEKYITILNVFRCRAKFFKYIGHADWNLKSYNGFLSQSCIRYLQKLLIHQPLSVFFKALWYYITHFISIEKNSNYYVDIIKKIEKNETN